MVLLNKFMILYYGDKSRRQYSNCGILQRRITLALLDQSGNFQPMIPLLSFFWIKKSTPVFPYASFDSTEFQNPEVKRQSFSNRQNNTVRRLVLEGEEVRFHFHRYHWGPVEIQLNDQLFN